MSYKSEIPEHWKVVVSSDILDIRDGTHDTPKYVSENGIPLITSKNLKNNSIDFEKVSYISEEDHLEISRRSKVEEGDILFAMIGTIGNPAIIKGDANFSIKNIGLFKKNEEIILPAFLANYLSSKTFEHQLNERKLLKGTTQKFIPLGSLRKLEIPLPPLTEQQEIVAKIEELLSELDKGKEQLETARQQLKVYRQAVLKWAFEGKLTNPEVQEGELPEGWTLTNLENVCEKVSTVKRKEKGLDEKLIYLDIGGIDNALNKIVAHKEFTWGDAPSRAQQIIYKNDVLFSTVRTYLKNIAIIDIEKYDGQIASSGFCVIRGKKGVINPKFIFNYSISESFLQPLNELQTGSSYPAVRDKDVFSQLIPLPPIEEQNQIVQEIESRLSVCDKVEETITQSLQQAETLRQSILKKAFEGKLVKQKAEVAKPKNIYFYQVQLLAYLIHYSNLKGIHHGEMTLAKYAYLLHKIYGINTFYNYKRWHLGPYAPEMKKVVNNIKFFSWKEKGLSIVSPETIFNYANPDKDQVENAIDELSQLIDSLPGKNRAHKTELFATVCKVIEDIKSTALQEVRKSLGEWKIDLSTTHYKSKAEKFSEGETKECLEILFKNGFDSKLKI